MKFPLFTPEESKEWQAVLRTLEDAGQPAKEAIAAIARMSPAELFKFKKQIQRQGLLRWIAGLPDAAPPVAGNRRPGRPRHPLEQEILADLRKRPFKKNRPGLSDAARARELTARTGTKVSKDTVRRLRRRRKIRHQK